VGEAQRAFADLGSQLLTFGEYEPAACSALATLGLNLVSAGNGLFELSSAYSRLNIDRVGLRDQIEKVLRLIGATPAASRQDPPHNNNIQYPAKSMHPRGMSLTQ
jgi:hypothetical protein